MGRAVSRRAWPWTGHGLNGGKTIGRDVSHRSGAGLSAVNVISLDAGRYFLEVARSGSIRQAADRLGIAPSAISRQIAKLEHGLNAALLDRRADGVTLTEAGQILLGHLETISDRLDLIGEEIADLNALRRGSVSIATVEGITSPFLSEQIALFREKHPGVAFHLRSCGRQKVLEALEQRRSQIGFIYDHFTHPALIEVGKWCQPLLVLAPPSHPLAGRANISLAQLAAQSCALPDESFGIHHLVRRVFARAGLVVNAPVLSDSLSFLRAHSIRSGLITFMPLQAALPEVRSGSLVPLDVDCPDFRFRHIYAVVRREQPLPPAVDAFLNDIIAAFGAEADRD